MRRIGPLDVPGGEKIQAQAEAGLDDGEALVPPLARRQAVAGQEDVTRLPKSAGGGAVEVIVGGGEGGGLELEDGWLNCRRHGKRHRKRPEYGRGDDGCQRTRMRRFVRKCRASNRILR